ncbi:MAG: cell division protein FtsW [Lentisphaeria bacterium]|nr:cell division protein FtsW [Lentisphaeria bacterium]
MKQRFSNAFTPCDQEVKKTDPPLAEGVTLFIIALVLVLFGLVILYSTSLGIKNASTYFFLRQVQWCGAGFTAMLAVILIGYKKLSDWSWLFMIGISLMLIAALLFPAIKGARRWIQLPGIGSIQPSEYAKFIIALFMAKLCSDKIKMIEVSPFKFILLVCVFCVPPIMLVMLGRDLGTTLLLSIIVFSVLYAAGTRLRYLLPIPLVAAPSIFLLIKFFSPFRWTRLVTYQNPELYQDGSGYQLWLSLLALGSGGWTGVGFAESRLKHKYLPEAHTDFILSIVGEELGFVWMCVIIIAYLTFVLLAITICVRARTRQGMFLVFGLTTFLAIQSVINIGVISGAFPTKGMPAPFISYGGSSLVACLTATGLIISVALDAAYPDYPDRIKENVINFLRKVPFIRRKFMSKGRKEA